MLPLLTNYKITLTETMPEVLLPITKLLTTNEQLDVQRLKQLNNKTVENSEQEKSEQVKYFSNIFIVIHSDIIKASKKPYEFIVIHL